MYINWTPKGREKSVEDGRRHVLLVEKDAMQEQEALDPHLIPQEWHSGKMSLTGGKLGTPSLEHGLGLVWFLAPTATI